MDITVISYYLIALIISITSIGFQSLVKTERKHHNRLFNMLLLIVCISSLAVIAQGSLLSLMPESATRAYMRIPRYVYFLVHTGLAPVFYVYIFMLSGAIYHSNIRRHVGMMVPAFIMSVLILVNPFTDCVYYHDAMGNFHRNWGEYVIYAFSAFYLTMTLILILRFWQVINKRRRMGLLFCIFMVITGVLIQLLVPSLRVELMFEAIGLVGVQLTIEMENDRIEVVTGLYNRDALRIDLKNYFDTGRTFSVIAVRIYNFDLTQKILGNADTDEVVRITAEYILEMIKDNKYYRIDQAAGSGRKDIYRASQNAFLIICQNDSSSNVYDFARFITERFKNPFRYKDAEIKIDATVMCTETGTGFNTLEDVMLLADGEIPIMERRALLANEELMFLQRNEDIENAVLMGVQNKSYEVFYQPIYRRSDKSVVAAQAYLFLKDEKMGLLSPNTYIDIASRNGLEYYLTVQIMDGICTFLNSGIPTELGIRSIGFRLPAVLMLREDFISEIMRICKSHDVDASQINLQIYGFSDVDDRELLRTQIEDLKIKGFTLAIDRFGTDDSNLGVLMTTDVDYVCVDIGALTKVGIASPRFDVLSDNINMIHELNRRVVIKGIRNEVQANYFTKTRADYLQGSFYSDAVSQNEFIAVLKGTMAAWREEQKARAQSEAKSSFLANMSHEIRTPINAILGMNEMILRRSSDDEILSYAGDIERAGKSLLSIINNILDFSKVESGSMEIVSLDYELSSLLNDVIHMFRERMGEKALDFKLDVDEAIPNGLNGDEVRIRQIMTNLLNNALKYTDKGSVTLSVRKEDESPGNIILILSVSDTGRGIKQEDLSRLYGKFQRLDLENNRNVEGSGLGLAITAGLLDMMGGDIEVSSVYGQGSVFTARIPQKVHDIKPLGNLDERYYDEQKKRKKYQESFVARNCRALVVDDTPMNIKVIKGLLRKTMIRIDEANSGMDALNLLHEKKYDIILLDYLMPGMDGIETLHNIRKIKEFNNWSAPVIALTANAISGSREQFLKEGFDDYLSKPVEGEKLEEAMIRYIPPEKLILKNADNNEQNKDDDDSIKILEGFRDSIMHMTSSEDDIDTEEGGDA